MNQDKISFFVYEYGKNCEYSELIGNISVPLFNEIEKGFIKKGEKSVSLVKTDDPQKAEFILFPYYLQGLITKLDYNGITEYIRKLPYFKEYGTRHIFFRPDDNYNPLMINSLVFKQSMDYSDTEPGGIAFPYFVENFRNRLHFNFAEIQNHTNFIGFIGSSSLRLPVLKSFLANSKLRSEIVVFDRFFYHTDEESKKKHRELYLNAIKNSFTTLCPAGTGKNTIRFFETLSFGRIPVLISDNCALPFEKEIDYSQIIIRIEEKDARFSSEIVGQWFSSKTENEIIETCKLARKTWEEYFYYENTVWYLLEELLRIKNNINLETCKTVKNFVPVDYKYRTDELKKQAQEFMEKNDMLSALNCLITANLITGDKANVRKLVEMKNSLMLAELGKA